MQPSSRRKSHLKSKGAITATRRLEPEFWEALGDICERESIDHNELFRRVEKTAPEPLRTRHLRAFILQYYRVHERAAAHRAALLLIKTPVNNNGRNPRQRPLTHRTARLPNAVANGAADRRGD